MKTYPMRNLQKSIGHLKREIYLHTMFSDKYTTIEYIPILYVKYNFKRGHLNN